MTNSRWPWNASRSNVEISSIFKDWLVFVSCILNYNNLMCEKHILLCSTLTNKSFSIPEKTRLDCYFLKYWSSKFKVLISTINLFYWKEFLELRKALYFVFKLWKSSCFLIGRWVLNPEVASERRRSSMISRSRSPKVKTIKVLHPWLLSS